MLTTLMTVIKGVVQLTYSEFDAFLRACSVKEKLRKHFALVFLVSIFVREGVKIAVKVGVEKSILQPTLRASSC